MIYIQAKKIPCFSLVCALSAGEDWNFLHHWEIIIDPKNAKMAEKFTNSQKLVQQKSQNNWGKHKCRKHKRKRKHKKNPQNFTKLKNTRKQKMCLRPPSRCVCAPPFGWPEKGCWLSPPSPPHMGPRAGTGPDMVEPVPKRIETDPKKEIKKTQLPQFCSDQPKTDSYSIHFWPISAPPKAKNTLPSSCPLG